MGVGAAKYSLPAEHGSQLIFSVSSVPLCLIRTAASLPRSHSSVASRAAREKPIARMESNSNTEAQRAQSFLDMPNGIADRFAAFPFWRGGAAPVLLVAAMISD